MLSEIENEIVFLKAINELIDSMINLEMLSIQGENPDTQVYMSSMTHQKFFNIILVDFLSTTDKEAPTKHSSYLCALKSIIVNPNFAIDNSISSLSIATQKFSDWLNLKVDVDIYLPTIDLNTTISLSRFSFLKMCGNISKHNFLRLPRVAKNLQEVINKQEFSVSLEDSMLALDDFYERFHTDIFNYHCSTIAEFLNNIRWGIYDYLQPEFNRSFTLEENNYPKYHYIYPAGVVSAFAKSYYWELMNDIRSTPYIQRFEATQWLKLRY